MTVCAEHHHDVPSSRGACHRLGRRGHGSDERGLDLRAQDPLILPAGARGRLVTYLAVTGTTVIFGLIPWLLVNGIESDFGPPPGSMALLIFWLAISFAWTAVVATAAQVWVTQTRLRSFVGLEFARVLALVVIPNTLVIFGLVLCFLTLV